ALVDLVLGGPEVRLAVYVYLVTKSLLWLVKPSAAIAARHVEEVVGVATPPKSLLELKEQEAQAKAQAGSKAQAQSGKDMDGELIEEGREAEDIKGLEGLGSLGRDMAQAQA